MNASAPPMRDGEYRLATWFILAGALVVALVSARPYAGGWNDGSRLATVESLVDHGTLAIDRSIFVQVPPRPRPDDPGPYPADDPVLRHGTRDRLYIQGHFYSDKPPVPALLMAGLYQGLQWVTGLTARERPDLFCYLMTLCTSGLAYLVAIWSVLRLGRLVGLSPGVGLALAASLGLATVALTYIRHVNSHILLLGVTAPLLVGLVGLADDVRAGRLSWWRLIGIGSLAGLGYSIDLGAGPAILPATMVLIVYRVRAFKPIALCVLAALPWIVLHHVVNYAIGGTWRPANAVPAYLVAAGGGFTSQNMTGVWNHANVGKFLLYAASLLFGKRGFFGHNLPLFLTLPALVFLIRRRPQELPGDPLCPRVVCRDVAGLRGGIHEFLWAGGIHPMVRPAPGPRLFPRRPLPARAAGVPRGFHHPERLGAGHGGAHVVEGSLDAADGAAVLAAAGGGARELAHLPVETAMARQRDGRARAGGGGA